MNCSKRKSKQTEPEEASQIQLRIIQQCKETTDILKFEQDELLRMFNVVIDKKQSLGKMIKRIEQEERGLKVENDELEYFLFEKTKIMNQLRKLISIIQDNKSPDIIDVNKCHSLRICQTYTPKKQKIGEELIEQISKEENQIINLKCLLSEIQRTTQELQESGAYWSCIRCKIKLKEGHNEQSCIYHPGKLKYFSCRTCGADEYFTCCQQCRDCNNGCTTGLHKP